MALAEGWWVLGGGGDTCAGLAGEGETGESQPREPACMWRVWPSVAVSNRAAHGFVKFYSARSTRAFSLLKTPTTFSQLRI